MGVDGRIMKTKLITAIVIVLFASLAIYSYTTQENKLHIQQIELKSRETKLKALDLKYKTLNTELDKLKADKNASDEQVKQLEEERQQLEKEKQQLQADLQAKLEAKSKLAQASQSVVNSVTNTQTASASSGNIQQIIVDAANRYGVDPNRALRIAKCESGFNPNAVNYGYYENGHPSGLFQHISGYWGARAAKYGYAGASVFDPVANANVTMGMWRDGQAGLWECR